MHNGRSSGGRSGGRQSGLDWTTIEARPSNTLVILDHHHFTFCVGLLIFFPVHSTRYTYSRHSRPSHKQKQDSICIPPTASNRPRTSLPCSNHSLHDLHRQPQSNEFLKVAICYNSTALEDLSSSRTVMKLLSRTCWTLALVVSYCLRIQRPTLQAVSDNRIDQHCPPPMSTCAMAALKCVHNYSTSEEIVPCNATSYGLTHTSTQ